MSERTVAPRQTSTAPADILSAKAVETTARMLKCLGHPLRLRVLDLLQRQGEMSVGAVHAGLDIEQARCSHHLSLMHDRGILSRRKDGVHVYYSLGDPRALKVLGCVRSSSAAES